MKFGNEQLFVRIEHKEAVPGHLPGGTNISCSVEASCDRSSFRIESVWFSCTDINRFLSELRSLEERRKGSANLVNQSFPTEDNPLRFEISYIDNMGHFALRADLLKFNYVDEDIESLKVSMSFPIDAGDLPSMLIEFRELFDCN